LDRKHESEQAELNRKHDFALLEAKTKAEKELLDKQHAQAMAKLKKQQQYEKDLLKQKQEYELEQIKKQKKQIEQPSKKKATISAGKKKQIDNLINNKMDKEDSKNIVIVNSPLTAEGAAQKVASGELIVTKQEGNRVWVARNPNYVKGQATLDKYTWLK
jgi:predicted glutamine amidotransferase